MSKNIHIKCNLHFDKKNIYLQLFTLTGKSMMIQIKSNRLIILTNFTYLVSYILKKNIFFFFFFFFL